MLLKTILLNSLSFIEPLLKFLIIPFVIKFFSKFILKIYLNAKSYHDLLLYKYDLIKSNSVKGSWDNIFLTFFKIENNHIIFIIHRDKSIQP